MPLNTQMKRGFFLLVPLLAAMGMASRAQTLYSNGATLYIANGGVVWVNGGAEMANAGALTNEGQLTLTKNSTFPDAGNFTLEGAATVNGNGQYHVEQDWVNNANFSADNSLVELYGNTAQSIASFNNTMTVFHDLQLTGTGTGNDRKKIVQGAHVRIDVSGSLSINDRELATETWSFYVVNPTPGAVTNSSTPGAEGFVSSLTGGYFSRATNAVAAYTFPTGSSAFGSVRYRPLDITPSAAAPNVYSTRLNNYDAGNDGFAALSDDVCAINELYYHSIERAAGSSAADIRFNYLAAADGNWNRTAHWQTEWTDMGVVAAGTNGTFATLTKTAWNFPDAEHAYVLATLRALPPVVACPTLCADAGPALFTATGSSTGYQWTVPAGATLVAGQGTANATVDWGTATGMVSVVAVGPAGCNSLPDECQPEIKASPTAAFILVTESPYSPQYLFDDASSLGHEWNWDFGDGEGSSQQSPTHIYGVAGTYEVVLTVTSKEGCSDVATTVITIEGNEVFVPNAFTPNADYRNEGFRPVNRSGEDVSFSIFNRWGERIYASSDVSSAWDGTYNGKPCPQDVYVCRVEWRDAKGGKKWSIGHVTLLK